MNPTHHTRPESAGANGKTNPSRQWALVGVLAVVLVGALMLPPAESDQADPAATETTDALAIEPAAAGPPPADPLPVPSEAVLQVRQLPRLDFDRIGAANPMAAVKLASEIARAEAEASETPPAQEQPAQEQTPEVTEPAEPPPSPPQTEPPAAPPVRVQAVYGSGRDAAALVEKRIVRPGQPLSDGREVLEVSDQGVRVQERRRPEPAPEPAPPAGVEIYDFRSN